MNDGIIRIEVFMTQVVSQIFRTNRSFRTETVGLRDQLAMANELYDTIRSFDLQLHRDVDLTRASRAFFSAAKVIESDYSAWLKNAERLYREISPRGHSARRWRVGAEFLKRFYRANHRLNATTAVRAHSARTVKAGKIVPIEKVLDDLLN